MTATERYALVVARFYEGLAERLTAGAQRAFAEAGVAEHQLDLFEVPGSFELPLAAKSCADCGRYRGVVCLGGVIRGDTDHYDYVCAAAAQGVLRAGLDSGVPCSFGVLTCDTMEQAVARVDAQKRDTGYAAASAVLQMAQLLASIKSLSQ